MRVAMNTYVWCKDHGVKNVGQTDADLVARDMVFVEEFQIIGSSSSDI